jgi:MATE family multidrug resistance protein
MTILYNFFSKYAPHYKALFRLGLPIVIGQIGMIVLGLADTLMIGHHTTAELGAASFVNNVFNFAIIFSMGFSYGLTPVAGGFFGKGDYHSAGQAFRESLISNILMTVIVVGVMWALYLNLDRLGQPAELMPLIRPYYILMIIALVFKNLFGVFKQFADSITETKIGMWILICCNLQNIVGNYLLIYGKLGFPEWGLYGAGLSTLCSNVVMLIAFIWIFCRSKIFAPYRSAFLHAVWSKSLFKHLNMLGWPIACQLGMETASFSLSAMMAGWLGTIALAAHQVMSTISTVSFMIIYGIGSAVAIRSSNFCGQHDETNIRRTSSAGYHLILLSAIVISILIFLLRNDMGGWFTDSREVSLAVSSLVIPFLFYQFGDGLQINYANALRGISDVKVMMVVAFFAYFIIGLPAGYFFGFVLNWGIVGIWMTFPFGLTSAGIMYWLRFNYRLKRMF